MEGHSPGPHGPDPAEAIEREIAAQLAPTPDLLDRVHRAAATLVARAGEIAQARHIPLVRAIVAGSAARGTFLTTRLDIDLFLLFPPDLDRGALERSGLELAGALLDRSETRYAEHPYLRGTFDGFAVDAVPGYAVEDPAHPISAVDRTPFHQQYLAERSTPEHVTQIRLTKQFLRALGVYGAEARTAGFSGYLVELLILRFGSLRGLLAASRDWRVPVRLPTDPAARPTVPDDVALILDDPVDPHRNVASALSRRSLGQFLLAATAYLGQPDRRFFALRPVPSLPLPDALRVLERRGTYAVCLTLPRPSLVDDILYPQLRKAERALATSAQRRGFGVLGTASAAGTGRLLILLEATHRDLPAVQRREGPPADIDRTEAFLSKWATGGLQGPYVDDDGHLVVETARTARSLAELLTEELPQLPIGRDLVGLLEARSAVRPVAESEPSEELARALGELLGKRLPWLDWRSSG